MELVEGGGNTSIGHHQHGILYAYFDNAEGKDLGGMVHSLAVILLNYQILVGDAPLCRILVVFATRSCGL